jgi:predicted nucleic acid-binding protein
VNLLVVDAGVWVARFVPQDIFHQRIRDWLDGQRMAGNEFLAPALLITEVAGAISRRTGNPALAKAAAERLEELPGLRLVYMNQALVRQATQLAATFGLRGADACYVAVAAVLHMPLVTLDDDQSQRAGMIVEVQNPGRF